MREGTRRMESIQSHNRDKRKCLFGFLKKTETKKMPSRNNNLENDLINIEYLGQGDTQNEKVIKKIAQRFLDFERPTYQLKEKYASGGNAIVFSVKGNDDILIKVHSLATCYYREEKFISISQVKRFNELGDIEQQINMQYCMGNMYPTVQVLSCFAYINGNSFEGDTWFFTVMKKYKTLSEWVKNSRIDKCDRIDVAVSLLENILCVLVELHGKGIIHRDITDKNIFVDVEGDNVTFLLGDFGIAKEFDVDRQVNTRFTDMYAAPEVLRFEKADHRQDIYSLALVVYILFFNKTKMILVEDRKDKELPLKDMGKLTDIITKALRLNPDERFSTADEMLQAVREIKGETENLFCEEEVEKQDYREEAWFDEYDKKYEIAKNAYIQNDYDSYVSIIVDLAKQGYGKAEFLVAWNIVNRRKGFRSGYDMRWATELAISAMNKNISGAQELLARIRHSYPEYFLD